jgi:putative membrane protein
MNLNFMRLIVTLHWREALQIFPWRFLLALGFGIATAILSLSRPIHWALEEHPSLVWAFFFGLVLASITVVRKRVQRWTLWLWAVSLLTATLTFHGVALIPVETPHTPFFVFLSGAIAICAMILPGISGAFILVLLGKYRHLLGAVITFDLFILIPFGVGCLIGLLSFSRILRWLFARFPDATIAALSGLMIGSLRKVWPWQIPLTEDSALTALTLPQALTLYDGFAILLMLSGLLVVLSFEKLASRHSPEQN